MRAVDMPEAEANLARLIEAVESGAEAEIVIARDGRPAARLVPIAGTRDTSRRLGRLAGKYPVMSQEEFDANNGEIAALFNGPDE